MARRMAGWPGGWRGSRGDALAPVDALARVALLLVVVVSLTAVLAAFAPHGEHAKAGPGGPVVDGTAFRLCARAPAPCVIDGDTIRSAGEVIRIADIDTPEVHGYRCARERVLAARATQRLLTLLNSGPVEVRRYANRDADVYARKLRVLVRDGASLGETLIAEGLAHRWDGARHSWCG